MKNLFYYKSKMGKIGIVDNGESIIEIFFYNDLKDLDKYNLNQTELIKKAIKEIDGYFKGIIKEFTIPISLEGTEFQRKVWNALRTIPYGETRSYKDIAEVIGNPKSCRAVGGANNKNPIPIIVPCHRVIGNDRKLVGYAGGLQIKEYLLELESGLK